MIGLIILLAVVGLGSVGLSAAFHAARCGWVYLTVVTEVITTPNLDPTLVPPPEPAGDGTEPAYRQYLFGPAQSDLKLALTGIRTGLEAEFRRSSTTIWAGWRAGTPAHRALCLVRIYGLLVGTLIGTAVVVAVTTVQILVAVVFAVATLLVILALRVLDRGLLRIKGVRMTCPGCYRPIGYPAYRCPNCGSLHRDVRPGRYGVLSRRCRCDHQVLPTLLLFGSHRLTAFCPHPGCGVQLSDGSGTTSEVLLPIVGGQNVGKTRLLTVIVKALQDNAAQGGGTLDFADPTSGRRIALLQPAVLAGETTRPTPPEQPRAYSMYLSRPKPTSANHAGVSGRSGRSGQPDNSTGSSRASRARWPSRASWSGGRRLIHLFDTAGEKFYESDVLAQLRYLGPSKTFLFVIDPLSIEQIWNGLDQQTKDQLRPVRARRSPEFVFQQILDNVERMSVNPKRARLAVALSKADLLPRAGITSPEPGSAGVEQWLDNAGLDNLVRTMRHAFGEVQFFHTSAMLDEDGIAAGVPELVEWLLAGHGSRRAAG